MELISSNLTRVMVDLDVGNRFDSLSKLGNQSPSKFLIVLRSDFAIYK